MNLAQPIRDLSLIQKIKNSLTSKPRTWMLFTLGINTGLRISDMLKLKVDEVSGSHIRIREGKTGKQKLFFINPILRQDLDQYILHAGIDGYLFPSMNDQSKPISRFCAHKLLKDIANEFGLKSFSAHSLRKTFGSVYYQRTKDIALLQQIFNHSSQAITLRYIGWSQEVADQSLAAFYL